MHLVVVRQRQVMPKLVSIGVSPELGHRRWHASGSLDLAGRSARVVPQRRLPLPIAWEMALTRLMAARRRRSVRGYMTKGHLTVTGRQADDSVIEIRLDPMASPTSTTHPRGTFCPTLIAMGGNSLIDPRLPPTVENQFAVTAKAVVPIAGLLERGVPLVLTHGNGPQVGFMQLRVELTKALVHEVPLDSLVADSQGAIGYMIQRDLREELERRGLDVEVATIVTEVEVDPSDRAFAEPTKPIGGFHSAEEAARLHAERGWNMVEDSHRGWRRVVASPAPRSIVQIDTIRRLVESGVTVIACGGGGIPVVRDASGHLRGIEAVIDKDRASALLAGALGVRRMIITTGVDAVYRDYLTARNDPIREITITELERLAAAGLFPPGSMGPKIEAAIRFLKHGGHEVVIAHPDALTEAFDGRAGTTIRKG
jgi:carbamate kinase